MKKLYAIYDTHGKYLKVKEVDAEDQIQRYLDKMYREGKSYMSIPLNGPKRKMDARKIKKLEVAIRKQKIYLNRKDLMSLEMLVALLKKKPARYGMIIAGVLDSAVRDIIPLEVWEAMGGEINK